jgi:glycosyltransferase involved in cell wall biosynthesis
VDKIYFSAVWVNPCFLDYRVPVYKALHEILNNKFTLIYSADKTTESVQHKVQNALGDHAIGLRGQYAITWGANKEKFANKGFSIPYQSGLISAIQQANPDVIISEGFFQWTPASLWIKLIRKTPLVIAYERTKHTERNAGYLRTFYRRFVVKQTDALCCNGVLSKEYCIDILGMPSDCIVTGAMAADTDELSERCKRLFPNDIDALEKSLGLVRPIFLYVGRLIRLKGLRELLDGWELYTKHTSLTQGSLLLVGEGPERGALENIVHEHNLQNVIFTGAVNYDDIAIYYAMSDFFIIPTLEDNWSLVVPEAMVCGKPILCSKYNGCWPELVQQDVNGWIFDPNNAVEISGLLKTCRDHMENLPMMGKASQSIVKQYSPKNAAEAVLKACHIAINHRN